MDSNCDFKQIKQDAAEALRDEDRTNIKHYRIASALSSMRDAIEHWLPPAFSKTEPTSATFSSSAAAPSEKTGLVTQPRTVADSIRDSQGSQPKTFLYLAYGSNLSAETFLGRRGIRPLNAINVVVPSLRLTFDLPGLPYAEPCFANSGPHVPGNKLNQKYHKNRWAKGLVGVVYELVPSDFYHVIATEGGGSSYQDITVECHPLFPNSTTVPAIPETIPVLAHTLFAPPTDPSKPNEPSNGRSRRPDPSYAQPSMRYLKLLRDGAMEHGLPQEYQMYLQSIRPYQPATQKQRLGQFVFLSLWAPFIFLVFALQRANADEKGKSPAWLARLSSALFKTMWQSYDGCFKSLFGDGERSSGSVTFLDSALSEKHQTEQIFLSRGRDKKTGVESIV